MKTDQYAIVLQKDNNYNNKQIIVKLLAISTIGELNFREEAEVCPAIEKTGDSRLRWIVDICRKLK